MTRSDGGRVTRHITARGATQVTAMLAAFALLLVAVACGGSSDDSAADSVTTDTSAASSEAEAIDDEPVDAEPAATDAPAATPVPPTPEPEPTEPPPTPLPPTEPPATEPPAEESAAEPEPADDPEPATEPPADAANADPAVVQMGADVYAANCARCHGETGEGTNLGRPLTGLAERTLDPLDHIDLVTFGDGRMPAFGEKLSVEEIEAVVTYTRATF